MTATVTSYGAAADILDPPHERWQTDPAGWAADRMGVYLWSVQRAIFEGLRDHPKVAVHAAHDTGKSYLAGLSAAWWIDVHPPGEAFVVSTAPTYKQVHVVLWEEIRKQHRAARRTDRPLPGRVLKDDTWHIGDIEVGMGRKPADHDEHGFQGIHRRYVLAIVDEACGIPSSLWNAVEAITTNDDARILAIGNPDDPTSEFARHCRPGSGWHVIRVDGLAVPTITRTALAQAAEVKGLTDGQTEALLAEWDDCDQRTDETVPEDVAHMLLSAGWVADKARAWGVGTPIWTAKVRGEFPEDAEDVVVPLSWARKSQAERDHPPSHLAWVELGVDCGAGGDESVIIERTGVKAGRVWQSRHRDPERLQGEIMHAIRETGARRVKIDAIGIGWAICGWVAAQCRDQDIPCQVVPVNVGTASWDPTRFPKLRDQLWWELGRELSEAATWDLSGLDDAVADDVIAQLTAPKYMFDAAGRVKIEKKDETKERLGRSPDHADALLLAFYIPPGDAEDDVVEDDTDVTISPI